MAAWWAYHRLTGETYAGCTGPEIILEALEEVEANPEACDSELAALNVGYVSQVPI